MKNFKIPQTIALIAILCHQSSSLREKRSFWPFGGGGSSTDVEENAEPAEDQNLPEPPQLQPEIPTQHLSPGYHYPIWRVHKYNGIELKPMPISLVPQHHLQRLHTQVSYVPQQQRQPFHQFQPNHVQHLPSTGTLQPNGQHFSTNSNCQAKTASAPIPPELQELAQQFGIKDASKLPRLEDAMGLLGTTTRAETIQTIKELAATPDGMNLIRQFLASDDGAAATEDANVNNQCNDVPTSPQFNSAQPSNGNVPHRQILLPTQHQQYGLPYPVRPHNIYGLPNVHQTNSFQQGIYQPPTHIMSLLKNEVAPNEEYSLPNELSTAHSEHQGYNTPRIGVSPHGHEIYGLPNIRPAAQFQRGYYAPRANNVEEAKSDAVPHTEYNVPNEVTSSGSQTQEPHQEYGVPAQAGESLASEQQETFGLPVQEPVNFYQQGLYPPKIDAIVPHQEYGVPAQAGESLASEQQETFGLPVQEPVNFYQPGLYPPKIDTVESAENSEQTVVPHREYNVPNEDNHQSQVPHEIYGIPDQLPTIVDNSQRFSQSTPPYSILEQPTHQSFEVPNNENENAQQDQQVPHGEYAVPSVVDTQSLNTRESTVPLPVPHRQAYALPHQRFFESPNALGQSQYGAPTKFNSNNVRTHIPILRQIDGTLDRTHTNLELGQLLTTTVRPEAGFLERVGAWTKYFAPPGPTIPIVPPQVTEDVNESVDHTQKTFTIPIPKIPELNEPQTYGLPQTAQLPNVYIPKKFLLPPTLNQGPFVRVHRPLSGFNSNAYELPHQQPSNGFNSVPGSKAYELPQQQPQSSDGFNSLPSSNAYEVPQQQPEPSDAFNSLPGLNAYELPHQQPLPFDGQSVEEFVPDISQLPLEQHNTGNDLRTSYGVPTHSYALDSSPAASETNEQRLSFALPNPSGIENEVIVENDVVDEEPHKKYGPQRISSYDSYATGKLNRASDDAIIQLIPTQKPHPYQARRLGQVEESSIIDAIATMTSGFRPIT